MLSYIASNIPQRRLGDDGMRDIILLVAILVNNLLENIELCKNARIENEKFEIIIEQDKNNSNKR